MKIRLFEKDQDTEPYSAGQPVFHEGDPGEHMFVVVTGAVDIIIKGETVETVEAGGAFGEMALLESKPRSASAIVRSDAALVRIDRRRFEFLVQQTPYFSLQLMTIMAERLRRTDKKI
jgi:CRP-like cAMP-binding protein